MSVVRPAAAGCVSALVAFVLVHASGCGTDAVGVDECRDIEYARCEAAQYCGLVDDVAACKRFYRDQCLHGMTSGDRPGGPKVKDCVATIKHAGQCAKEQAVNQIEDLAACTTPVSELTTHTKPCEVVREPEGTRECEFLYKPVIVPEAGPDAEAATEDAASDASAD